MVGELTPARTRIWRANDARILRRFKRSSAVFAAMRQMRWRINDRLSPAFLSAGDVFAR